VKAILPFSPGTRSRWSQQRQPSNQHSNKDYLAGSRAECPHRAPSRRRGDQPAASSCRWAAVRFSCLPA
jgi:hypothetical protein